MDLDLQFLTSNPAAVVEDVLINILEYNLVRLSNSEETI
jgi:hypothetical protein